MKRFYQLLLLAVLLLVGGEARAFTSTYSSVTVPGTFNSYNTTSAPMALVSNNVWRTALHVGGVTNPAFLFTTNGGFGTTWKVNTQPVQPFPVTGTTVNVGGNDITLTGLFSGTLTFQLNTATKAYGVDYDEGPWTSRYDYVNLAGSFNGYETLNTNMVLISNGVWQSYVTLSAPVTNPVFLFATRGFTNSWKESNQAVFALPLSGTAEFNTGGDISINGILTGTLRFQLNEMNGAYRVENVTAGSQPDEVWINELHYENAGDDLADSIEFAGPAGTVLTNYQLVGYNGGDGKAYRTNRLSGVISNMQNGMGVMWTNFGVNGFQNGPTDAVALVKGGTNVLLFLSYEGVLVAGNGPAAGMTSVDIGVQESTTSSTNDSLQLIGTGAQYSDFTWTGPITRSPGAINSGQIFQSGAPAASVLFSNLVHTPSQPGTNDAVYIDVDISPQNGASNLTVTTFYRVNSNGYYRPLAMSRTGTHFRTYRPVPLQAGGSYVEYYTFATYSGTGTNSPQRYPSTAPDEVSGYGVSRVSGGAVWVNEINPAFGNFDQTGDVEYVELAGVAGSDVSGWHIELYDTATLVGDYTLPEGSVLPNDQSGFGFFVLGDDPEVLGVDLSFGNGTNSVDNIPDNGALRLLNDFGVQQQAVWWAVDENFTGYVGYAYAGMDSVFFSNSLAVGGVGGNSSDFSWQVPEPESPGAINLEQTLVGGNTNNLAPTIVCPSNLYYTCLTTPVPTVNVASVSATGLCAGGAVTVTHVGDVTNSGSGCGSSEKIITRTYRAVSACGTTSTCSQLIIYQDNTAPVLTLIGGTQTLVNAGFESGSLMGWTPYGTFSNQASAALLTPYQGFAHGLFVDPASAYTEDNTGNGNDGLIYSTPRRGLAATNATAFGFDGLNDRIDIPYDVSLNNATTFSFSVWAKPDPGTSTVRAVLGSVTNRGYTLYQTATNGWRFSTGLGTNVNDLNGPSVSTTAWVHLVGTYSNSTKMFFVNGLPVNTTTVNYVANTQHVTRIGAGSSGVSTGQFFFKGLIDDVQLYSRALSPSEVSNLYKSGSGRTTGVNVQAHLKLDEPAYATNTSSGVYQELPASSGQTWSVSGYLRTPGSSPIRESNRAVVELQFLNATTVVQSVTSQPVTASSTSNIYVRYTASIRATTTVTAARATVRYLRNSDVAGEVYFDAFTLSRFAFDPGGSCTYSLPDLRVNVTAADSCSVVSTSQSPAIGYSLPVGDHDVVVSALDQCGQTGSTTIRVSVVDSIAPAITVSNLTVACDSQITSTTGVSVVDCSPVTLMVLSEIVSGGNGCSSSTARLTTRVIQAVDDSGFTAYATQVVSQVTTTAPVISVSQTGALVNAGFELGSLTNWNRFGNAFVSSLTPHGGSWCAKLAGQNTGSTNYNGLYQEQPARAGQHWRAAGWVISPSSDPLAGSNTVVVKMEFLSASMQILQTLESATFTATNGADIHTTLSTQGYAPTETAWARLTVLLVQPPTSDTGSIRVDDLTLSQSTLTAVGGTATLPNMTQLPLSTNACSTPVITQLPDPGTTVPTGVTNIKFVATDPCGRVSTATVALVVVNDEVLSLVPPAPTNVAVMAISLGSTNIVVRSLGTNSWSVVPEYSTNLLSPFWLPISNSVNSFSGGTNATSFGYPVTNANQGVIIRVLQRYP